MDNEEKNADRRHSRRYPISLESCDYEGEWFSDGTDLLADLIEKESYSRLRAALKELRPEQQLLICPFSGKTNEKEAKKHEKNKGKRKEELLRR